MVLKPFRHVYSAVFRRYFAFYTIQIFKEFHPFFRSKDKDNGRKHVTEHTGMINLSINDDRITHNAGTGWPAGPRITNMMVADAILDEVPFIIPGSA